MGDLPSIDEHATTIDAGVDAVWSALLETLDRTSRGAVARGAARVVGCVYAEADGPRPLVEGSTIPGFRVAAAVPGRELALEGRHRFSSYALTFRLEPVGSSRSRLRAESRAEFPGLHGRAYRLLVIGTRGHVFAVRRLLSAVAAHAVADRAGP